MALPIREGDIPGIQLRTLRHLALGRDEAWRWLTEKTLAERWLADRVEIDPGPRGGWRLERDVAADDRGRDGADRALRGRSASGLSGSVRRTSGGRHATRLEITLVDAAGGCDLDLLQVGFHLLAMSSSLTIWEEYRHRWRDALERLRA